MNAAEAFRLFIDHSTIADKRKGQLANRYLDMACKASEDDAARALLASMTEDERAEMKRLGLTLEPAARNEPDAECVLCGSMYFSAEGHKSKPVCRACLRERRKG